MAEAEVEAGIGRLGVVQWMVGRRRELEWWWSSVDPCQFVGGVGKEGNFGSLFGLWFLGFYKGEEFGQSMSRLENNYVYVRLRFLLIVFI